jgi:hypothetical protein
MLRRRSGAPARRDGVGIRPHGDPAAAARVSTRRRTRCVQQTGERYDDPVIPARHQPTRRRVADRNGRAPACRAVWLVRRRGQCTGGPPVGSVASPDLPRRTAGRVDDVRLISPPGPSQLAQRRDPGRLARESAERVCDADRRRPRRANTSASRASPTRGHDAPAAGADACRRDATVRRSGPGSRIRHTRCCDSHRLVAQAFID